VDFSRWLRSEWDRVVGFGLIGLGAVFVVMAWFGVSDSPYLAQQLSFITSGGIGGLFLLGAGAMPLAGQTFQFTRAQRATNGDVNLTLSTPPPSRAYRIEVSSNIVDWQSLITFPTNVGLSLSHTDSAAPYLNGRFYRGLQVSGSNIFSGDHLDTTNGEVIIHPHQHAAIILRWNGKVIHIDPKNDVLAYTGQPKGDLVLITHVHSDHFNTTTIEAVRSNTAPIICTPTVWTNLTATQKSVAIIMTNGASTSLLGFDVDAIPAYNANHPIGTGNGYALTFGGKRIYVAGDTGDVAEMRALTNIDVAFVPINLPFTMSVSNAVSAVRQFKPKVVYPYHFSPSTPTTDVELFKRQVGTDLGIEVRLRKWY